jgi:hypothetical protein
MALQSDFFNIAVLLLERAKLIDYCFAVYMHINLIRQASFIAL